MAVWIVALVLIVLGVVATVWGVIAGRPFDGGVEWRDPSEITWRTRLQDRWRRDRSTVVAVGGAALAGTGGVVALLTAPPW